MIVQYQAPKPWRSRGIDLIRLLPQAQVEEAPAACDLAVRVTFCRNNLQLVVGDNRRRQRATVPAATLSYRRCLFRLLSDFAVAPLSPWGILTGVRPGKLAARLMKAGGSEYAAGVLAEKYLLTREKAQLLVEAVNNGQPLLADRGISLYVNVPFCPSRCDYCSFASLPLAVWRQLLPRYIAAVAEELTCLLAVCRDWRIPINSVYVGGGTPTSLGAEQLAQMLAPVKGLTCEFTVEAGRPDTVSSEHLLAMEGLGVTRTSINCQYPDARTLAAIGRKHSVAQFYSALERAMSSGIALVNSDLIIGLPGQTEAGFSRALEQLMAAGVQNITVHALALKRGAKTSNQYLKPRLAEAIARGARQLLAERGYQTYYLYRQRDIAANLENVGYGLPGTFCYYNIASIAESEPVFGVGAGAVSKLVAPGSLAMLNNPRDPNQYLARREELLGRKLDWLARDR